MKLSFSTLGCPSWTLAQIAQNGSAMGFDGVELRIDNDKHLDTSFDAFKRKTTRELFNNYSLTIACISGYTFFCGDNQSELALNGNSLLKNAELAYDLNVPYVRTFLGKNGDFTERGAQVLRETCDKAASLGITVLMEIHDSLKTGKQASKLLSDVNSKGLAILWDIQHSYIIVGGENPDVTWNCLSDNIRHVHFKDVDANNRICHIGQGVLPVTEIARLIEASNFDGFLSYEWEKTWVPELDEPETALPKYIEFMRGITF